MSFEVETVTLIRTRLMVRGKGTEDSPLRTIEQYWNMQGELVMEYDSFTMQIDSSVYKVSP